jgi:hypothetical protein
MRLFPSSNPFNLPNDITGTNNLAALKRTPADSRRYRSWAEQTKAEYGNLLVTYLLAHRLLKSWGKPPFSPVSTIPFATPADYRVLMNDWPYGFSSDIQHMVVWTRTTIATDPHTGDMTPDSREIIAHFVKAYFTDSLGPDAEDRVMWFKNWGALQSVSELQHIHVLVRYVKPAVIEEWTRERECHQVGR